MFTYPILKLVCLEELPVYVFSVLSACRHCGHLGRTRFYQALRRMAPFPITHPAHWLRLCRAAGLVEPSPMLHPTQTAAQWFEQPPDVQRAWIFETWCHQPESQAIRRHRQHIWDCLREGRAIEARQKRLRREITNLLNLGFVAGEDDENQSPTEALPAEPRPWRLEDLSLLARFPTDLRLLWQLEGFLTPIYCGYYALSTADLRLAAQRGSLQDLARILEQGLQQPLSPELLQRFERVATISVLPGPVLAFTAPEELAVLRQSPGLRRQLDHLLSPRHVALHRLSAATVLQKLARRGFLSREAIQPYLTPATADSPVSLNSEEAAFTIACLEYLEQVEVALIPPPGMRARLEAVLTARQKHSALRQAEKLARQAQPAWLAPEVEPPPAPPAALLSALQHALENEEAVDILYQEPNRQPQARHITPLLLEQRGLRYYLLALDHTRRANRTFRVDRVVRLLQPGEDPCGSG